MSGIERWFSCWYSNVICTIPHPNHHLYGCFLTINFMGGANGIAIPTLLMTIAIQDSDELLETLRDSMEAG